MCFSGLIEKTSSTDKLVVHTFKSINKSSLPTKVVSSILFERVGDASALSDKLSTQPTLCQMI